MEQDTILKEAAELIIKHKAASPSFLQRKFRLGYLRARRVIDQLESLGVVGPDRGLEPREILVDSVNGIL